MLIVSWNVAGLSTTLHRIDEAYGRSALKCASKHDETPAPKDGTASEASSSDSSRGGGGAPPRKVPKLPRSHAFAHYLSRHGADVLCVQEAKIPHSQLSSRSEPLGCALVPGYESFWSCCHVDDKSKRGFNGVVTYAKVGTVRSADPAPLGRADLDEQGRCVMTDHGDFVIFNVYVPCGGGANSLTYKMRFLNALRRAMRRQREERRKKVVLVGDLNIAHRPLDVFWKYRRVHVNRVIAEVARSRAGGESQSQLPQWKVDLENHWKGVQSVLESKEAVAKQTTNSATGETFDKFRVCVTVGEKQVFLGKHEETEENALCQYEFPGSTYYDEDAKETRVVRENDVVSVDTLTELMSKIAKVDWDVATQRSIASIDWDVGQASPTSKWLNSVLEEDGMIDTFRHFYPNAEGRYTCWHQYTNRRFENEGCRIDYAIVDGPLMPHIKKGAVSTLRHGNSPPSHSLSEEAALMAATANGLFQGASYEGGGIATATQRALDTQFGPQHTGLIYTPPSFSDHIATSLLLCSSLKPCGLQLEEQDPQTRKSQPHKSQPSIASFFGTRRENSISSASSATSDRILTQKNRNVKQKQKESLQNFFKAGPKKMMRESSDKKVMPAHTKKRKGSEFNAAKADPQGSRKQKGTILNHFSK